MLDRGTVVKWFEFCRVEDKCSTDCPYFDNTGSARECTNKLAKDVLTLLKEREGLMLALEQSNAANEYLNAEVERLTGLLKEQKVTQKDGYNLQELWKRARAGETLNETELNFLLADWDERNIFKQQEAIDEMVKPTDD